MQGGWAGAEQASPAPSQALGAKGFLPWASGAAGGGGGVVGCREELGPTRPPCLGALPALVSGDRTLPRAVLDLPPGPSSSGQAKIMLSVVSPKNKTQYSHRTLIKHQ